MKIMNHLLLLVLIIITATTTKAQTWEEIFDQKKTQTKYLVQQVAALQVYIGHVKKTYQVAKDGLNFIGDMSKGELNLHKDYFQSLKNVNPEVSKYSRVAEIIALQIQILNVAKLHTRKAIESEGLQAKELDYLDEVYGRLIKDCLGILDELATVTTSSKLEMTDDQRVKRIHALYTAMQDNLTFAEMFGSEAVQLGISRKRGKTEIQNSRKLNDLK